MNGEKHSSSSYWQELHDKLIEKLNQYLEEQDTSEELGFFFEPVSESEQEEVFSFTNPFKKAKIKFYRTLDELTDGKFKLLDQDVPEEDLQELLNALDHVKERSLKRQIKNINKPHWNPERKNEFPYEDFYETENQLIISIEVPFLDDDEIDIRATPFELEIKAGEKYHRQIPFDTPVNPDTAIADYNGKGLIEVKLQKLESNENYTPIEVRKPIKYKK